MSSASQKSSSARTSGGSSRGGSARQLEWHQAGPAPLVLLTGPEKVLHEHAIDIIRAKTRKSRPDVEYAALDASSYTAGSLVQMASPSLFSTDKLIIAHNGDKCSEDFVKDVLDYLKNPAEGVALVVSHAGGQRAKKMLDALKKAPGASVVVCPAVKKDAEKFAFVHAEFKRRGRTLDTAASKALIEAVGSDVRELAASCSQLAADVPEDRQVTAADVDKYYGGRAEATGFKVADAVVARNRNAALRLARQAMESGVSPVPLVAVLATRIRTLIKVAGHRGGGASAAKELGMAPWQFDRARKDVRAWTAPQLAQAMIAIADADEAVKGGSKDPLFAVERAVMVMCSD